MPAVQHRSAEVLVGFYLFLEQQWQKLTETLEEIFS